MMRVVMMRSNPVRPYPRLEKMANCIVGMGNEVTVLAWDRDETYAPREETLHLKNADIRIIRVGIKGQFSGGFKKNAIGLAHFEKFIYSWLKKHRREYDVIHAYDFDCGYVASKIAKKYRKKFVYDIADYYVESHGFKDSFLGNILEKKEIEVINSADATIICTEERVNQISKAKPKEVVVIHNTPDLEMYEDKTERMLLHQSDRLKLVYVGVLGTSRFIDSIAEVVSERNDCEFHIGGFGGGMEELFKLFAAKYDNIFFYGRIPYRETIELEKECDVMCALYDPVVPNHRYAAPNKFYEALALGKPLIMAKNTGMSQVVEDNQIGEVITYNKNELNEAIDRLIQRRNDATCSERMSDMYATLYSWKIMKERIEQLYQKL